MADPVANLPTDDQYVNTPNELRILQRYFERPEERKQLLSELKVVLIGAVVFFLLANPGTQFLLDYMPHMGSPLIRQMGLVVFFIIGFYVALLIFRK